MEYVNNVAVPFAILAYHKTWGGGCCTIPDYSSSSFLFITTWAEQTDSAQKGLLQQGIKTTTLLLWGNSARPEAVTCRYLPESSFNKESVSHSSLPCVSLFLTVETQQRAYLCPYEWVKTNFNPLHLKCHTSSFSSYKDNFYKVSIPIQQLGHE